MSIDLGLPIHPLVAQDVWEAALRGVQALGVQRVVFATPPLAPVDSRTAAVVTTEQQQGFPTMQLVPSYWLTDALEAVAAAQSLVAYQGKYVLLALPEGVSVRGLKGPLFEIRARGYEPVILHHEPRTFAKFKLPALEYLNDLGCLLQLNLMTLTGAYGQLAKSHAEMLLAHGLVQVLTTGISSEADAEQLTLLNIPANVVSGLEQTIKQHAIRLAASSRAF